MSSRMTQRPPVISPGPVPAYAEVDKAISEAVFTCTPNDHLGMFLSGGIDSTMLLSYVLHLFGPIPVFTVAIDPSHPDLVWAETVAKHYGVRHIVLLPDAFDLFHAGDIINRRRTHFNGDDAVYLALELAHRYGVKRIIATDGIDELMGGYWWHANVSDRYTDVSAAFEDYWQRLDAEQIYPMKLSADRVGIEVSWPFLDDRVVQVISRIPVSERVKPGIPKAWWKRFAREYVGIPDGVVERQKLGFVSALTSDIGPMKVRICGEVQ